RDRTVDPAAAELREMPTHDTARVDHRADPGGGGTQHRQPFLDRPQPRLREMLGRAMRAEPGVVRRIEDVVGTIGPIDDLAREDDLVADLDTGLSERAQIERARTGTGEEVYRPGNETRQAERLEQRPHRQVFAVGNE